MVDSADTVVAWLVSSPLVDLDSASCMIIDSSSSGNDNNNNAELLAASEGLYDVFNHADRDDFYVGAGTGDHNDSLVVTVDGDPDDVSMAVDDEKREADESFIGLVSGGRTIAERRAVKRGKMVLGETDVLTATCTPSHITIPSGTISPATMSDSPIMLPNSQVSPTTGSFATPLIHDMRDTKFEISPSSPPKWRWRGMDNASGLCTGLASNCRSSSGSECQVSSSGYRDRGKGVCLDYLTVPIGQQPKPTSADFILQATVKTECPEAYTEDSYADANISAHPLNVNATRLTPKTPCPSSEMARAVDDGYNWRKYGQKQVKGSECPRSYYKCTHPDCTVRKKVERSLDSHVTEIIYNGRHNHPIPPRQPSVLGTVYPRHGMGGTMGENSESCVKTEGGSLWRSNFQPGSPSTPTFGPQPEGCGNDDNDNDEDRAPNDADDFGDDDVSESRKRKSENCSAEPSMVPRSARKPRVIFEMESEVDILEDGFRWRKYGQKVVKGNPNPRSYYKCTSTGCTVRKHVERASHDSKTVITTYEGKHKHGVPTARNTGQMNSNNSGNLLQPSTTQASWRQFDGRDSHNYEQKHHFSNHILQHSILGNYRSDTRFGSSSTWNYLPLPSSTSYCNPLGLSQNHTGLNHPELIVTGIPGLPLPLPYDLSGAEYYGQQDITSQAQTYLAGQQVNESDMIFTKPKEEHNDDHSYR